MATTFARSTTTLAPTRLVPVSLSVVSAQSAEDSTCALDWLRLLTGDGTKPRPEVVDEPIPGPGLESLVKLEEEQLLERQRKQEEKKQKIDELKAKARK